MLAQRASPLSENLTKVGQGCITGEVIGESKPRAPDILRKTSVVRGVWFQSELFHSYG